MARKIVRNKKKYPGPPHQRGTSFKTRLWFLLPAFLTISAAIVLWLRPELGSWVNQTVIATIIILLGWGIVPLAVLLGAIFCLLVSRRRGLLLRRWYRWLGLCALGITIWGLLAWIGRGGILGSMIIGSPDAMGSLRILGLSLAGIILLAPGAVLHLLKGAISRITSTSRQFKIITTVLFLGGLLLGILFWQRSTLTSWGNDIAVLAWGIFGWGLPLLLSGITLALASLYHKEFSEFIHTLIPRHWNKWLGSIALLLAVWGILSIFSLGGSIGFSLIGYPSPTTGMLRIMGLLLAAIIFIAPGPWLRATSGLISALADIFRKPMTVARKSPEKIGPIEAPEGVKTPVATAPDEATKAIQPTPVMAKKISSRGQEIATTDVTPGALRQVAQEVWKKYGESPTTLIVDGWRLPPIDILDRATEVKFSEADNVNRAMLIEKALASYGVDAKVVQINVGPTVTQFGVEPGWDRKFKELREKDSNGNIQIRTQETLRTRVKVDRITSLTNDLALALSAPSIRIEAPVPGKPVVGIEVPNTISERVSLRGVIESSSYQKLKARSHLTLALGKGAGGEATAADLTKMPHLLIAGATGSGKTVCLNSIICCLLLHNTPFDVRFIMIDPKRVELTPFNGIPHMSAPVIVDTDKALGTMRWLNQEMDQRYKKMAATGVRNIDGYNKDKTGNEKMPYLVLVIDELADLMMAGFEEVEHILCRLAQLARATGIHLVVATQRPSVDVVTGLIKANFPTRISFAVTSQVDSRTILDHVGAEKLLGRGDMLYMPTDAAKPKRLQGCFVSDTEAERLVYFWGNQNNREAVSLIKDMKLSPISERKAAYPQDPLLESARQLADEHVHISASYIQRHLRIGYNRAARLMEQLTEEQNVEGEE